MQVIPSRTEQTWISEESVNLRGEFVIHDKGLLHRLELLKALPVFRRQLVQKQLQSE
jgi:hypothetical protein